MTVAELIEKLGEYPPGAQVIVLDWPLTDIEMNGPNTLELS